jgi:hypothetical protein
VTSRFSIGGGGVASSSDGGCVPPS